MIAIVNWEIFHTKFYNMETLYVTETEDAWNIYTSDGRFIVHTMVEKKPDQEENMMFVERYLANRENIIYCKEIVERQEVSPEEEEPKEIEEEEDFEVELSEPVD